MAVHDNDIEILHAYLDGELPVPECEGLWRRLAVEPELTAELDRLRTEHDVRQSVWSSLEPTDQAVAMTAHRIFKAARRNELVSMFNRGMLLVSSIAAMVLVGFSLGWMEHGHNSGMAVQPSAGGSGTPTVASNMGGGLSPQSTEVSLRDSSGHVFSINFGSHEEAQQFADDIETAQRNREAQGSNTVVPAMERY
jgi:anti-sigma factor RsiW